MTVEMWLWVAVGLAVAAVLAGIAALAVLYILASGENGPRRFGTSPVDGDLETYFDEKATWAATASVTVPGKPDRVWSKLTSEEYLRLPLLFSGPKRSGDTLTYRGPFAAWSEQVVRQESERELTTTGVGVSVPLVFKSFGQRYLLRSCADGTTVAWTVAITPKWIGFLPLRWTGVFARPVLQFVLRRALK